MPTRPAGGRFPGTFPPLGQIDPEESEKMQSFFKIADYLNLIRSKLYIPNFASLVLNQILLYLSIAKDTIPAESSDSFESTKVPELSPSKNVKSSVVPVPTKILLLLSMARQRILLDGSAEFDALMK